MMKRLFLASLAGLLFACQALAQQAVAPCVTITAVSGVPSCAPVTAANPWPTTTTSLPATLGTKTAAGSLSVVQASDDPTTLALGTTGDTAYAGSGAGSLIALQKGLFANTTSRSSTTIADGTAHTASFQTATQTTPPGARGAMIWVNFGTVSGTSPTDSLVLQWSPDGGTSWVNYGGASANVTASSFVVTIFVYPGANTNMTTGANVVMNDSAAMPTTWRLSHVIGGTTPSFTVNNTFVNYLP